jgi:hypothetical protein
MNVRTLTRVGIEPRPPAPSFALALVLPQHAPMDRNACVLCDRSSDVVPLLTIEYRGSSLRICSEHLPVLIHDPGQLAERLPGVQTLGAPKPKR